MVFIKNLFIYFNKSINYLCVYLVMELTTRKYLLILIVNLFHIWAQVVWQINF